MAAVVIVVVKLARGSYLRVMMSDVDEIESGREIYYMCTSCSSLVSTVI